MAIVLYATYLYGTPDKKVAVTTGEPRTEYRNQEAQDPQEQEHLAPEKL
jgi:hypothetical protein